MEVAWLTLVFVVVRSPACAHTTAAWWEGTPGCLFLSSSAPMLYRITLGEVLAFVPQCHVLQHAVPVPCCRVCPWRVQAGCICPWQGHAEHSLTTPKKLLPDACWLMITVGTWRACGVLALMSPQKGL